MLLNKPKPIKIIQKFDKKQDEPDHSRRKSISLDDISLLDTSALPQDSNPKEQKNKKAGNKQRSSHSFINGSAIETSDLERNSRSKSSVFEIQNKKKPQPIAKSRNMSIFEIQDYDENGNPEGGTHRYPKEGCCFPIMVLLGMKVNRPLENEIRE